MVNLKKTTVRIAGMHCGSCELLIETKLTKVSGIEKVVVNRHSNTAVIYSTKQPDLAVLNNAVCEHGYTISSTDSKTQKETTQTLAQRFSKYTETFFLFVIVALVFLILKELNLFPKLGITENMSLGVVFVIGLVAAMSTCIAVTGGLLVAIAAKYNELHPNLNGIQRLKPHLYFNVGRILSYTIFGGVVGALGSVITLSPFGNGILTILASLFMLLLGLQMLKLFPSLGRFQPKIPNLFGKKILSLSSPRSKAGPFALGALTFFLPCGFTQALQIYVLSQGSWSQGALIMLTFSLGTLPALLSLGTISSFAKGAFQNYFIKVAGVIVVLLGIFNVNNGLTLTGFYTQAFFPSQAQVSSDDQNVQIVNGKQIVKMKIVDYEYTPSRFTVYQGVPVEWEIDASQAAPCGQMVTIPRLGINEYIPAKTPKTVTFVPKDTGSYPFNCSMGMMTRGAQFTVVPNTKGIVAGKIEEKKPKDGEIKGPVQDITIEVSKERGFYPRKVTVKKGIPVRVTIDAKTELGGCGSTMVVPGYDIGHFIKFGKTSFTFTPKEIGVIQTTCSMGCSKLVAFEVVE